MKAIVATKYGGPEVLQLQWMAAVIDHCHPLENMVEAHCQANAVIIVDQKNVK